MSSETVDITSIAHSLVSQTAVATASIGGSHVALSAELRDRRFLDVARALTLEGHPPPPPPPPPPLPEQLGPFIWNPIVFGGGVPVGGWSQLVLHRDGAFNFTGHFHDSGAPSYDMSCVFAVRAGDGTVYTFSHRGRVHGTFEAGSRDDDWGDSGTNPALAAGWPTLVASPAWSAKAGADADFGQLLDQAVRAVGAAAAVIAIV